MKLKSAAKIPVLVVAMLLCCRNEAKAATYTVSTTLDHTNVNRNPNTLRWAIEQANSNAGPDIIVFNIPNSGGNTFESDGAGNRWAVISLVAALPTITGAVTIDGTTQANTNTGFIAGKTVGVTSFVQGSINYPDVYIVPSYTLPNSATGTTGNGLTINATNVTIRGLAISGFGNTSTSQPEGTGHADIAFAYASAPRTTNSLITQCFLSCDPRGAFPALASRRSKGGGLLVLGNNNSGTARQNYVAYSGGYGIVFHATQDNVGTTAPPATSSSSWLIEENQVISIGTSTVYTAANGRAADGISMMTVSNSTIINNYIEDWEQFAIDMGHNADRNVVTNNTVTRFVRTTGSAPCGGIRTGFSSDNNSIRQNRIFSNTSANFIGGIYTDESRTSFSGATIKNNSAITIERNAVYNNSGSGIVASTQGAGSVSGVTITQNSTYDNTGLGIDLGYTDLTGPTQVTVNDNGDGDTGPNNLQNFPIITDSYYDAVTRNLVITGQAPAGSTIEVFATDGGLNRHTGRTLNYGEGKTYLGTGVEGSASDLLAGTASYNVDGNIATNNAANFQFRFPLSSLSFNIDEVTATATLAGSTSEFGPKLMFTLRALLFSFGISRQEGNHVLRWNAAHDQEFSHFEVERSTDAFKFSTLSKVKPSESASSSGVFQYIDQSPSSGFNYYRLKLVDHNGSFSYSAVVSLINETLKEGSLRVGPNPFDGPLTIHFELQQPQRVQVLIADLSGRVVLHQQLKGGAGQNSFVLPLMPTLPKGLYTVVVNCPLFQKQLKVMRN